jgi:hypothetical protein
MPLMSHSWLRRQMVGATRKDMFAHKPGAFLPKLHSVPSYPDASFSDAIAIGADRSRLNSTRNKSDQVPTMSELIGEVIEHEIEEIVEEEVSGKGLSTTSKVFLAVIGVLFGIWWLR